VGIPELDNVKNTYPQADQGKVFERIYVFFNLNGEKNSDFFGNINKNRLKQFTSN